MKKINYVFILAFIAAVLLIPVLSGAKKVTTGLTDVTNTMAKEVALTDTSVEAENEYYALYETLELDRKGLDKNTFEIAVTGYNKLSENGKIKNNKLSIVDFSQPSTKKRLYIIDMKAKKLLFHTLVAHGKNSGNVMAKKFSNTNQSLQSSLGFYVTAEKYQGKHGLSMRMDGVEKTNSNARARAIVVHGASYVSEQFVKSTGYLGRSWGCPAVSQDLNEPIINAIGNGSALFIYSPQADYVSQSSLIAK